MFGIKRTMYNFDPINVFMYLYWYILKTGFVVQGHICTIYNYLKYWIIKKKLNKKQTNSELMMKYIYIYIIIYPLNLDTK